MEDSLRGPQERRRPRHGPLSLRMGSILPSHRANERSGLQLCPRRIEAVKNKTALAKQSLKRRNWGGGHGELGLKNPRMNVKGKSEIGEVDSRSTIVYSSGSETA